jgi:hypothetical protein
VQLDTAADDWISLSALFLKRLQPMAGWRLSSQRFWVGGWACSALRRCGRRAPLWKRFLAILGERTRPDPNVK